MKKKKILFILGTRPEAIKCAPVILGLKDIFQVKICLTGQHREMVDQVMDFFEIKPDYDLNLMSTNQSLENLTSIGIHKIGQIIKKINPDLVFVQGDTTTAFLGALASFYQQKKVAHLEAGLRSFDNYSPYPEEINRKLISVIADLHFAPTNRAVQNLMSEGIHKDKIFKTGNTVIDALLKGIKIIENNKKNEIENYFEFLDKKKKIILVTGHRRESWGAPFEKIIQAIREIVQKYDNIQIVYPVHLNPNVKKPVENQLSGIKNIYLLPPLPYSHLIWLMKKSILILTDSGGIQEEAPSLNKPVLVMREITERTEGIKAKTAKLVGTNLHKILNEVSLIINKKQSNTFNFSNPYGDGKATYRIKKILQKLLNSNV